MPVPSVIMLQQFVKLDFKPNSKRKLSLLRPSRGSIFARDNNTCQYCGSPATTLDHIVPKSKGGQHSWENLVAACSSCNKKKGSRLLSDMRDDKFKLMDKPKHPGPWNIMRLRLLAQAPKDGSWLRFFG
ncbi:hypothetical protein GUITHDRAFT_152362 [Guillardia theta CCMP2712]|uniref:HNH nuclease domain-containing protein n=1 Tax=Guillardia theta (strain CCMP2712) TaxID=905079 RepID=L1JD52_GUITC|nr:hypothetical protein GUITHDRAFT_152362 [Guillardia theta CCMP2712]EKX46463.1 hypothetical protein GUITHDRAFT_152362 [Guillardia theta CCMP2712]|eukprot:XP_005833443.1 hypothetical protein GUITHDRAFT_152362 [Guillardia theta CCMP2712]